MGKTSYFWIVFPIVGVIFDALSYRARLTAIPLSTYDVWKEYFTNHQPLFPMITGPTFVWLLAYFLTALFIK